MKQRPTATPIIAAIAAFLLMALASYFGSYYALLDGREQALNTDNERIVMPVYRWDGHGQRKPLLYGLFWPAHQLDRLLRPSRWQPLPGVE